MRTLTLGLLWIGLLLAVALPSAAADEDRLYPVELLLTTTSDWTDVRIVGATLVITGYETIDGSEAVNLRVAAGATLSISQSVHSMVPVSVRYHGYLADLTSDWLQVRIEKGHLGSTTVSVHAQGGLPAEGLVRFTHRGVAPGHAPENARTFPFRTSEITSKVAPVILEAPSSATPGERKVLAFYYPWYGNPEGPAGAWVHWEPNRANWASTHVPAAGYYDSLDPETVRRHIREAKAAGIDGFIASWWGLTSFENRALPVLFAIAEEEGFLITVYYEAADTPMQIITDVSVLVSRYRGSPAFLTAEGLPAVFFYVRVTAKFTLAQWQIVFDALDDRGRSVFAIADSLDPVFLSAFQGLHTYNPVALPMEATAAAYKSSSLAARLQNALFAATVIPGYEEAVPRVTSPRADRADGETYRAYWALARASKPHWILITSFNEWHEGSEIEPSLEFGRRYLGLTAELSAAWRSGIPLPDADPAADRDGDGIPDAADYCPDYPGSPQTNGC